jgi:VCBS repeat-containing protein
MTVTCVDDPPTAVGDSFTVSGNSSANDLAVLTNDTDIDGGPKAITGITQPHNGTVNQTGSTSLTYTPDPGYCSPAGTTDDFTYTLAGGSSATVHVTVDCSQPPTAVDDTATVNESDNATPIDVLANDTDPDGGTKAIDSVTQGAHGSVAITGSGSGVSYTLNDGYCNNPSGPPASPSDSFTYTLNGGDSGTVSVTIVCVDDAPTASNDSATVTEDASATAISVLSNDSDIDGGPKTINSVNTTGTHGAVEITGGGSGLTYEPDPNYCNGGSPKDTFTYTLNGGSTATVSMTVTCVDDPPVAVNDSAAVPGISVATSIDVLSNDTDIDGGPKAIGSFTEPDHGTVSGTGGSTNAWTGLTYKPDSGYCGNDSFEYTLAPGGSSATVSINVDCSAPPTANNDSATVQQNAAATLLDVRANDTDSDGGPMLITDVTQPPHGAAAINFDGTALSYQPDPGYCNTPSGPTDNFSYTLNGGPTATVFMTVTCPAPPPDTTQQQQTVTTTPKAKCKKGFKKVKGKCKKKKKRKRR